MSEARVADRVEHGADFVQAFADAWATPTPDRLLALLRPDVRLRQPILPEIVGHDAAREEFRRLFSLVPDLHAEVLSWAARDEWVLIECRMHGTFGGRPLSWDFTDRFRLEDGLGAERVSYFDSLPVAWAMLRAPRGWPRLVRAGAELLRRR
jgi:ketosteroid isomerase-like protein